MKNRNCEKIIDEIEKSSKNTLHLQMKLFSNLSNKEILYNFKRISKIDAIKDLIYLSSNGNIDFFYSDIPNYRIEKNIYWTLGILDVCKEKINFFIKSKEELFICIQKNEFNKCLKILDKIDYTCGISTWSITLRGTINRLNNDQQKTQIYLHNLQKKCPRNFFFNALARNLMVRYEDSTLFASSSSSLRNQILRTVKETLQSFFMYKIVPKEYLSDYKVNFENIFNYEVRSSIVDLYLLVLEFVASNIHSDLYKERDLSSIIINYFNKEIKSLQINHIFQLKNCKIGFQYDSFQFSILDNYTRGNYNKILEICKENNDQYYDFNTFEIIAKSAARLEKNPFEGFKGYLVTHLINVINRSELYNASLSELNSISYAFSYTDWYGDLSLYLIYETTYIR